MLSFLWRASLALLACTVGGCAAPIIAGLTFNQVTTVASAASSLIIGKGFSDYALEAVTGKDCSITEGLLRSDRKICERRGSPATASDYHGIADLASAPASKTEKHQAAVGPMEVALADHANPHRTTTAARTIVVAQRAPAATPILVAQRAPAVAPPPVAYSAATPQPVAYPAVTPQPVAYTYPAAYQYPAAYPY